jgi:hypothetical protein
MREQRQPETLISVHHSKPGDDLMNTNKPTPVNPLAEGQMVIIVARWVLVLTSLFLILADAESVSFNIIRFEIMAVLLLAVSNFFLIAQLLTKRKVLDMLIYGMSLADLAVISLVIAGQGGFSSNVYTFYFPALLAFSVAFPTLELYLFLGTTVSVYSLIGLLTIHSVDDFQTLIIRLLMFTAIAVCGNYFARIERNRYNAALQNKFVEYLSEQEAIPSSHAAQPSATR